MQWPKLGNLRCGLIDLYISVLPSVICSKGQSLEFQTIPILRIFDEDKAREFHLGFLGMKLDWEHRFGPDFPIYMQVSKGNLVFHLSEHSGDCTPGSSVLVRSPMPREIVI